MDKNTDDEVQAMTDLGTTREQLPCVQLNTDDEVQAMTDLGTTREQLPCVQLNTDDEVQAMTDLGTTREQLPCVQLKICIYIFIMAYHCNMWLIHAGQFACSKM